MGNKKNAILRRDAEHQVRIKVSDEIKEELIKSFTAKYNEVKILKNQAAETAAVFRNQVKEAKDAADELLAQINEGRQEMVLCEEIRNYKENTFTLKIKATGKIVEKRPMTPEDDQLNIADRGDEEEPESDEQGED